VPALFVSALRNKRNYIAKPGEPSWGTTGVAGHRSSTALIVSSTASCNACSRPRAFDSDCR